MDKFLLDTNVIIDAFSAKILECLNYSSFYVSQVVFKEEIAKQIPTICNYNLNLLNESLIAILYNATIWAFLQCTYTFSICSKIGSSS